MLARLTDREEYSKGQNKVSANADEVRLPPMAAGYDCRSALAVKRHFRFAP